MTTALLHCYLLNNHSQSPAPPQIIPLDCLDFSGETNWLLNIYSLIFLAVLVFLYNQIQNPLSSRNLKYLFWPERSYKVLILASWILTERFKSSDFSKQGKFPFQRKSYQIQQAGGGGANHRENLNIFQQETWQPKQQLVKLQKVKRRSADGKILRGWGENRKQTNNQTKGNLWLLESWKPPCVC